MRLSGPRHDRGLRAADGSVLPRPSFRCVRRPDARFDIAPYDFAAAERLSASSASRTSLAQVLVRRGLADPAAARALPRGRRARTRSTPSAGCARRPRSILGHVGAGSRITVHGDYDVDGVASTAILVRALRTLGADVDWYLPSRIEDGYGLAAATVERLAARGTGLLVTVDCAITAVEEVAAARAAGHRRRRHRPPRAARRRRAARRADRPPAARRLPVPGPVRGRRRLQARAGAARRRGRGPGAPPTRTSTSSRSPRSPTSSRCAARTAASCAPGLRALAAHPQARACAR